VITIFILTLSKTDIASDEIEKLINPRTEVFNNLVTFELIDDSSYRGIFGVFLGLFRNLRYIRRLILRTLDRNINVILEESLGEMKYLEEILLTSKAPRVQERFKIIRKMVPNLKKISVCKEQFQDAQCFFLPKVQVFKID